MSVFTRAFPKSIAHPDGSLDDWLARQVDDNPWFSDLLARWEPAGGVRADAEPHLRLAVRDGYLNFYRNGQSVAKVEFGPRVGLRAEVHAKYVEGPDASLGRLYRRITSGQTAEASVDIGAWIEEADGYSGDEKRFVEEVVAVSRDVIDLEMALPAIDLPADVAPVGPDGKRHRVAPRIDLVALEPAGPGWRLALWEAKLVDDGRIRCEGDEKMPEVKKQIENYKLWLEHEGHEELVLDAYRATCRILVGLHGFVAARINLAIGPLGEGIRAVAEGASLLLDKDVRLLIDARKEKTLKWESFEDNGHKAKLEGRGIHLQMVRDDKALRLVGRP
ncbi:hypothetical protein Rumeso_04392 [Rubellimicrobium mesophilum DSM 19309]|uniref:Uncharacterized protein n=1 Tax=Rubellimicrobium mesophilum DSM 19309 TaxID=442562 RepID=A0A017HI57_9RHOB|nr:hypothetical protein [Rubellimicrobium mesophilum]EYD74021.1 hypothetical protein Rumeso_04392 [Rubellimicrobium mesophilum DSM 19309]